MPHGGHGEKQLLLCSLTEAPLTETLDKYNELSESDTSCKREKFLILSLAFSPDAGHSNGWVNFQGTFIYSS